MVVTTRRIKGAMLSVLGIVTGLLVGCGGEAPFTRLQLSDLTGRQVDPLQTTDARATVFLFTRTDCPISNRYAPEVRRLYDKFASSNVAFWLVYLDREESVEAIRRHKGEYEYTFGALRDPQHALVRMTGARVTPEAAVFVPGGRMVYRGRIDDRYVDFGRTRPAPTKRDLEDVLEAVLEGRQIATTTTTAVGCFIQDLQ